MIGRESHVTDHVTVFFWFRKIWSRDRFEKCAGNAGHFDSAFGGYKDGGGHRYGIRGRFLKNALEC